MKAAIAHRSGSASDPGLQRPTNEDRLLADDSRGLYAIADGVGGHVAGEKAAEIAITTLADLLSGQGPAVAAERRVRLAITEANNRIFDAAAENPDYAGMACVLTVALIEDDQIAIGQVGDTRLYIAAEGRLRKVTPDHSPVGEQEDEGELSEEQAMRHPRRSEIFRDIGTQRRGPDDAQFIHTDRLKFSPESALLLCSDGLSDALRTDQMLAIINRYEDDPAAVASELVRAANMAGGKDNVSVVFLPGPAFKSAKMSEGPGTKRHTTTRMLAAESSFRRLLLQTGLLLTGIVVGILLWATLERVLPQPASRREHGTQDGTTAPRRLTVSAGDSHGITTMVAAARPGDTVLVPPGEYLGPVILKDGVTVASTTPQSAVLLSDPTAGDDAGAAFVARHVSGVLVEGFRIQADQTHPLRVGVLASDASAVISGMDISGALDAGIRAEGGSKIRIYGNNIHENAGAGVLVKDAAAATVVGNWVCGNGRVPNSAHPGLDFASSEKPILINNIIERNGVLVGENRRPH